MRGTLYRISNLVRQYDQVQSSLSDVLGLQYKALPAELVESFTHDPAHVLGHTRRLIGHAAVDDIHERLLRQRKVFSDFLVDNTGQGEIPRKDGVDGLRDPIQNMFTALERLQRANSRVASKLELVGDQLKGVQETQLVVKEEYYDAVGHTSSAYPEVCFLRMQTRNEMLTVTTAFENCRSGRNVQRPIPAFLGTRSGRSHPSLGYCNTGLAKLWQDNRSRRSRFPHHPCFPERIYWRTQVLSYSTPSSTIVPALVSVGVLASWDYCGMHIAN